MNLLDKHIVVVHNAFENVDEDSSVWNAIERRTLAGSSLTGSNVKTTSE